MTVNKLLELFGYQSRTQHYTLHQPQPAAEHVQTWAAWSAWCEANKAELMALFDSSCAKASQVVRP